MNSLFVRLKEILLHGFSLKLRPYEQAVLDAWRTRLSKDADLLLSAQLRHLVCYQRQAGEKILGFFTSNKRPYPGVPGQILFPCKLESCAVARVHLIGDNEKGIRNELRAEVVLHKGRLIYIEFNQSPAKKLTSDVEVSKIEIVRDAMIPASEETISDTQRREEILMTIVSKLPDEYLQLVGENKQVSVNDWAVHSIRDIRKIPQRDGNYYLLAEKEGTGAIGVKEDEFSGQLYYLDYGDDRGEKFTVGFRRFLEAFDGGKIGGRF